MHAKKYIINVAHLGRAPSVHDLHAAIDHAHMFALQEGTEENVEEAKSWVHGVVTFARRNKTSVTITLVQ